MAGKRAEIKEQLNALSKNELLGIVLKLAAKKEVYDFLLVNYFDKQSGEIDLFEEAKKDIEQISSKKITFQYFTGHPIILTLFTNYPK